MSETDTETGQTDPQPHGVASTVYTAVSQRKAKGIGLRIYMCEPWCEQRDARLRSSDAYGLRVVGYITSIHN